MTGSMESYRSDLALLTFLLSFPLTSLLSILRTYLLAISDHMTFLLTFLPL